MLPCTKFDYVRAKRASALTGTCCTQFENGRGLAADMPGCWPGCVRTSREGTLLTDELAVVVGLQDNMPQKDFSKPCKDEVQRYQQESVRDIRLNHRLFRACKEDVGAVCAEACDFKQGEVCGGKVRELKPMVSCLVVTKMVLTGTGCSCSMP